MVDREELRKALDWFDQELATSRAEQFTVEARLIVED
jgi:hypothetical protein